VLATASWLLQTTSTILSHAAILRFQRQHQKTPWDPFSKRSLIHSVLCGLAVILRETGRAIAVINALWILAWCVMSYTNVMETPYCTTALFSRHQNGWMRLWNFDSHQFVSTKTLELWCLVFGSAIAYCACVAIFLLTSEWTLSPMKSWFFTVSWIDGSMKMFRYWPLFKNWERTRRISSYRYRYEFVFVLIVGFTAAVTVLTHLGIKGIHSMP
jgi:hypothetical protein